MRTRGLPRDQRLAEQNRLLALVDGVRARLASIPTVVGVGVGAKEIGGEISDDIAFRVYVDGKRAAGDLRADWRIPPQIEGVLTDVVVKGGQEKPVEELVDKTKYRPLRGGAQVKNEFVQGDDRLLAGTIGCLVQLNNITNDIMGLTCEHVIRAADASNGAKVGQPNYWVSCCCCVHGQIGTIFSATKNSVVDCALIRLDPDIVQEVQSGNMLNRIQDIGVITGPAQAVCHDVVRKRGRTTETTSGEVIDVIYDTNQILISGTTASPFADVGDSGAVLVNATNGVVGLLWARATSNLGRGVANHISEVMRELNILIAGTGPAGLTLPTTPC